MEAIDHFFKNAPLSVIVTTVLFCTIFALVVATQIARLLFPYDVVEEWRKAQEQEKKSK